MKKFKEWLNEMDALSGYQHQFKNPKAYHLWRLLLRGVKIPYIVQGVTPSELQQMWDEIEGVDPEAADSYEVDFNNLTINRNPNPSEDW